MNIDRNNGNTRSCWARARGLALGLCSAVVLGGSLPELGNIAMYQIQEHTSQKAHYFNSWFLALGIIGVVVCGIACYRRLVKAFWNTMEVK